MVSTEAPVSGGQSAVETPGRPDLFVLSTANPDAVIDFYRQVMGWELQSTSTFPDGAARGPGGQLFIVRKGPVGWQPFLPVTDLKAVVKRAADAGGRVVYPLPDDTTERAASVFDPSGPRLGLYQPTSSTPPVPGPPELGSVVWMEEKTRDRAAATTFHETVFGFTAVGPTGPGKVQLLKTPSGPPYAGIMEFDGRWEDDYPAHWLLYACVEDLDESIAKGLANGGTLWFPPTDTPLGWLAYLRDPEGNAFSVVKLAENPLTPPPPAAG